MRLALSLCLLALAATAAPAAASPVVKVRTPVCESALEPGDRAARFEADMRTMPGALKLQIRFTLQARSAEEPEWGDVEAPGFGTWNTSVAGIGRFVYSKTVQNLLAPASYRTLVNFRWLGPTGKTLLRARRYSRLCRQADLRPDLVPSRLLRDGEEWVVSLGNAGRSDAGPFRVTIETGGRTYDLGRVTHLAAGADTTLRGAAPGCMPGETVTVRLDPDGGVEETDEDANLMVRTCAGPV
jgi:hypothetical protein